MDEEKVIEPVKGVSKSTIARTVCLFLAIANQIMVMMGMNPIPIVDDTVYDVVSLLFTIGTSLAAWWKNNSFTRAAIQADTYKKELKNK